MFYVFIYVDLKRKGTNMAFLTVMLLHFIVCKLESVIIHFISKKQNRYSTLLRNYSASFYLLQICNIWIFVEIMLKYVHTSFCYVNEFI